MTIKLMDGDISKEDGLRIMMECEHRKLTENLGWSSGVQIFYNGQWMHVCRTDLKDDVCTFMHDDTFDKYVKKLQRGLGVRVRQRGHNRHWTFAIIDGYSDG